MGEIHHAGERGCRYRVTVRHLAMDPEKPMKTTGRRLLLATSFLAMSACAGASGGAPTGAASAWVEPEVAREIEIVVSNDWTTVARVSIMSGGNEITLGRVEALRVRTFTLPSVGVHGMVQLVARPNAVMNSSGPTLSDAFPASAGDHVSWTLRAHPAMSGAGGSPSLLRVTRCQSACQAGG
jgi:hypothetical protein